ncbi:uncharacterized protein LOC126901507 [Daktulosphaira vitifoliae]|uniref:uncharacterized protein LOC126901507 n=1 Tax=Daktulosphaira vitifoliae TaxID=58002 RepID=UPI0021AA283B|nr:uncharacterized protein LOC126901507 [Daktulosphaira vitifoliae]
MSNHYIEIPDPRSPTVDFSRTPLRIRNIINEENISRIINDSFVELPLCEPVSSTPTIVYDCMDTDDSFHSAVCENDNESMLSGLITPDVKDKSKTLRKALGCINNRLSETPKSDMRRKLWRNMEEERVKKGVNLGEENTPPLPFNDITASAPPKLYRYRKFT